MSHMSTPLVLGNHSKDRPWSPEEQDKPGDFQVFDGH